MKLLLVLLTAWTLHAPSAIALQNHGDSMVRFRSLKIRALIKP